MLCGFEGAGRGSEREASLRKVSGDDSWRAPPVPIPNTEVKPPNADGTELGTAWESRKLPGSKRSGRNESFSRSQNIRENGAASGSRARRASREAEAGARAEREPEVMCEAGACAKAKRKVAEADRADRRAETNKPRHRPRMILSSSMAEHSAVNRRVVSSSLT